MAAVGGMLMDFCDYYQHLGAMPTDRESESRNDANRH
jgi:hypothetical protein